MMHRIVLEENPKPSDVDVLGKGIMAYATSQRDLPAIEFFAFFIRNEQNEILGGCEGNCLYGCMYVGQLWVSESLRGQGYGTQLMQSAERHGIDRGCTFAAVNTMDWEALGFYQKLGYEVELARKGFMKNAVFYFLRKDF